MKNEMCFLVVIALGLLRGVAATTNTLDDLDAKIAQLSKQDTTVEEVLRLLGEPRSYRWGHKVFTRTNLPATYLLVYSDGVSVGVTAGRVWELRSDQPGPGFAWRGKVRLGSSLEEVLAVLGQPAKTVTGEKLAFKPGVLYRDFDGEEGYCYYSRPEQNIRLFFKDYRVSALYLPLEELKSGDEDAESFMQVTAVIEVKDYDGVIRSKKALDHL